MMHAMRTGNTPPSSHYYPFRQIIMPSSPPAAQRFWGAIRYRDVPAPQYRRHRRFDGLYYTN